MTEPTTQGAEIDGLMEHLHRALINDGWQGHPDPLTDDDVLAIAETAAAAALRYSPNPTADLGGAA